MPADAARPAIGDNWPLQHSPGELKMFVRRVSQLLFVVLVMALPITCVAQDISQAAVSKAKEFLQTAERGRQINNLMHFGTTYTKHEFLDFHPVKDSFGNVTPKKFAVSYRFWWDRQYSTDLAVFCSASGSIEGIRPLRSDGIAQAPFLASQATVTILGNVIYESLKENMSEKERRVFREIVDRADTKALLEMQLVIQQAVGR